MTSAAPIANTAIAITCGSHGRSVRQAARAATVPRDTRPAHARGGGHQRGQQHREHVVGDAVDQRSRQQRRRRHARQQLEQAPLEHAEPGRHRGQQAGHHRDQVQADEAHVAGARDRRQQHVQRAAGQAQLDHAEHGHAEHGAVIRQPQRVRAERQRAALAPDREQHRHEPHQQANADAFDRHRAYRQRQRRGGRLQRQRQPQQHPGAKDEAERADQHYLADLAERQADPAVAAQAYRAAGERGEAQGLADGMGQERRNRDARRMQLAAAALQADRIGQHQAGIAAHAPCTRSAPPGARRCRGRRCGSRQCAVSAEFRRQSPAMPSPG